MVDGFVIYDSVVHNPTAEEKKILDGITFKEKSEYRYKVDDKYVYYVKEDLEKNRPLVKRYGKHEVDERFSENEKSFRGTTSRCSC